MASAPVVKTYDIIQAGRFGTYHDFLCRGLVIIRAAPSTFSHRLKTVRLGRRTDGLYIATVATNHSLLRPILGGSIWVDDTEFRRERQWFAYTVCQDTYFFTHKGQLYTWKNEDYISRFLCYVADTLKYELMGPEGKVLATYRNYWKWDTNLQGHIDFFEVLSPELALLVLGFIEGILMTHSHKDRDPQQGPGASGGN